MKRTNVDGNLFSLSKFEDEQDAEDIFREMHEQAANDHAMEAVLEDDFLEFLGDVTPAVYERIAIAVQSEYDDLPVDYAEVGRLLVHHLVDDIVNSNLFEYLSEQYIETKMRGE